jgi:Flp pilus assembly protein TadD
MSDVAADQETPRQPTDAALRLINVGRADDAAALLSVLLAEQPDNLVALGLLALACLRAHRWADALTAADAAIGLAPDYLPAWQRRAIALLELDRPAEAEASAVEYLRLGPDQWYAHYLMARVLYPMRGRRQEALRYAEYARELAPNQADVHNLLGVVHRALEHRAEAETAYRAALAVDPMHALARSNLALLHLGRSGTEETMAGLRAAAASDPQQDSIHQNMALVSVLALVRRGTWLAQADLLIALLAFGGDVVARLAVVGVLVFGWLVVLGWWWLRLRRYLRSLVPAALGRLMRRSHARWGLGGIVGSVVCAVVAVWTQPAVLVAGYMLLLGGAGLSRALVVRDRRRAALDRS